MKRIVLIISILLIFVISGCNNFSAPKISEELIFEEKIAKERISEEQAKAIVLKNHTKNIGKVEIISVSHKDNEYLVMWENQENCEHGTDYVDDKNGDIKRTKTTIC